MLIDKAMQDDARYQALLARDATQDGRWFYAVRTTGVYCRPSCASRPTWRPDRGRTKLDLFTIAHAVETLGEGEKRF